MVRAIEHMFIILDVIYSPFRRLWWSLARPL